MTKNPSINLIKKELLGRGWKNYQKVASGIAHEVFQKNGYVWETPRSIVEYPFLSTTARSVVNSKVLTYQSMTRLGLPIPATIAVVPETDFDRVREFLYTHKQVVVKPENSSGSKGLTVNVRQESALRQAMRYASRFKESVLVQEQIQYEEYRLTVISGRTLSVIHRETARLCGDGSQTLGALLAKENDARRKLKGHSLLVYPQLELPKDMDSNFVPRLHEQIVLNESSLVGQGASLYEVGAETHASYERIAERIAADIGADFVVIDLMISDIRMPAADDSYVVLELNGGPALTMYSSARNHKNTATTSILGDMFDVLAGKRMPSNQDLGKYID